MEALGRGHDLRKLDLFIQGMTQALGPEVLQQYVNLQDYIKRRATALGIETEGLIKSQEQIAQEQQQAQMQQMMMQAGPGTICSCDLIRPSVSIPSAVALRLM